MSSPRPSSPSSVYSYPSELTFSPSPTRPQRPRDDSSRRPGPPRLSSPHHFRDIFIAPRSNGGRSLLPDPNITTNDYYTETMNDVNRALQTANRALQSAQEAFQPRTPTTTSTAAQRRQDVVDLTGTSPPIAATSVNASASAADDAVLDHYLSRMTHPHDFSARQPHYNNFLNDPVLYVSNSTTEEDPIARFAGPDSLAGPRRRYDSQRFGDFADINMHRAMTGSTSGHLNRPDEEAAIWRQRRARAQWEENQRRTSERQRLEQQRQRLLNSPTSTRHRQPETAVVGNNSSPVRPPTSSSSSSSSSSASVEAVDLTQVDDESSLAAALSKQRQDAVSSQSTANGNGQPSNSGIGSSSGGRTALTAYKCPICMEAPQNATTTACGHLFCHKCIIDTLKWSEQQRRDEGPPSRKVKGVCPVCRKELARKEAPGASRTLIALELKLLTKADLKRKREQEEADKEEERQRKRRQESKGKGKVQDVDDHDASDVQSTSVKAENSARSRGGASSGSSSQKENQNPNMPSASDPSLSAVGETDSLFDFDLDERTRELSSG